MKIHILLVATSMALTAGLASAADASATWNAKCAMCHAKDGSGNTAMGKKGGAKDYTKADVQAALTDEALTKAIKDGAGKMPGFKDKLTDDDVKGLVAQIRSFKK